MSELKILGRDASIAIDIYKERERQDFKWGDQSENPSILWTTVLTEEVGEVAKAVLDFEYQHGGTEEDLRKELIQVAAVAVAWVEALDKRNA